MEIILVGAIGTVVGIVLKSVFDKFKSRKNKLKYAVTFSYLGATEDHPFFGSIELLYNKTPVKNLFMAKLEIVNDSFRDIDTFELNITCDDRSFIALSAGSKVGALKSLEFSKPYLDLLTGANPVWLKRRDYIVPVLNRKEKVEISMLVSNPDGVRPTIFANIEKIGYSIIEERQIPKVFGESAKLASVLGLVTSLAAGVALYLFIDTKAVILPLSLAIGLFAQAIGVLIIKAVKAIIRLLS